jgi:hypothetical protein
MGQAELGEEVHMIQGVKLTRHPTGVRNMGSGNGDARKVRSVGGPLEIDREFLFFSEGGGTIRGSARLGEGEKVDGGEGVHSHQVRFVCVAVRRVVWTNSLITPPDFIVLAEQGFLGTSGIRYEMYPSLPGERNPALAVVRPFKMGHRPGI